MTASTNSSSASYGNIPSVTTTTITPTQLDASKAQLLEYVTESLTSKSGRGSSQYVFQTILSQHDRFAAAPVQLNSEMVGLTFFTKPRFNLTTSSCRQDRVLAMLDTLDPLSFMFSLRCNLDTVFAKSQIGVHAADASPFLNQASPFNIPLGNMMSGISGFPDFNIEYKTTESGYFSEDMTMARGADWGRRTYNIGCTFRDIQGGYIMAYFYYWIILMALQMEGAVVAYSDDRQANRLNYTCSIYRFILDPSLRTIVKWAKATGCYPTSIPIGDCFNYAAGDSFIHASEQFTIPFIANNVRYMDPAHLEAFNVLVERYIGGKPSATGRKMTDHTASSNFTGIPYVDLVSGTNELQWWAEPNEMVDPNDAIIKSLSASILSQVSSMTNPNINSLSKLQG